MLFALLVLATPRIGPPPNVCPLKPEPEPVLELEDDDPDEVELPPASEELPEEELPEEELPEDEEDESPELPVAEVCAPALPVC
jgi:hypothetical protein